MKTSTINVINKKPKRIKKDTEPKYCITPKGLFFLCINDAFPQFINDPDFEHNVHLAWELFESRMMKHGYVDNTIQDKGE